MPIKEQISDSCFKNKNKKGNSGELTFEAETFKKIMKTRSKSNMHCKICGIAGKRQNNDISSISGRSLDDVERCFQQQTG